MKLIMENWRRSLKEMAMKKPADISTNLALAYGPENRGKIYFILYDPTDNPPAGGKLGGALYYLQQWLKQADSYGYSISINDVMGGIANSTYAVAKINVHSSGRWEGREIAAESGWGPTIYELMMILAPGGLMSDRKGESSEHTRGIWKKYMERVSLGEVEALPLEPPYDMALSRGGAPLKPGAEYQKYAFKVQDDGSAAQLMSNHDAYFNAAKSYKGQSPETNMAWILRKKSVADIPLFRIVQDFFGNKYREAGYFGGGEDY